MKKYRLKDRDLQRKLDEISGGDFSKRLNDTADVWANNPDIVSIAWETGLGKQTLFKVWIPRSDIEEIPQYAPSTWNEWPNVIPPARVLMRVEILTERLDQNGPEPRGGRKRFRGCASFDGQYWNFYGAAHLSPGETVRFRPWEDKE